jgi:hypothetical protein
VQYFSVWYIVSSQCTLIAKRKLEECTVMGERDGLWVQTNMLCTLVSHLLVASLSLGFFISKKGIGSWQRQTEVTCEEYVTVSEKGKLVNNCCYLSASSSVLSTSSCLSFQPQHLEFLLYVESPSCFNLPSP